MNYKEAIKLANAGEEKAFELLYIETFKSKYYLALQYMKNEESAQDVLQEAYMKAFSKLDTLDKPEAFSGWLGKIVANTAKNALVKKNPLLFTDIVVDDEEEEFEYQIEDESIEYQPEIAYTKQETKQLVCELMDTLSEEQRMCILMFHIEGISIKEIASTLGCSENTVKSRLKYGRDNLKIQAEELQKKGYKLYTLAPIPWLLYLLRTELVGASFSAASSQVAQQLFPASMLTSDADASAGVQDTVNTGMQVAKSGLIHSVTGKIAVGIIGLCIAGGFFVASRLNLNEPIPETPSIEIEEETIIEDLLQAIETQEEEELETNGQTLEEIYEEVRRAVANRAPGYEFLDPVELTGVYGYFLYDIEGDGIDELIVGAEFLESNGAFLARACRVYSAEEVENGYVLKPINGEIFTLAFCIIEEERGLYLQEFSRGSGHITIHTVTIENDEFIVGTEPVYNFTMGNDEYAEFANRSETPQWIDIMSE